MIHGDDGRGGAPRLPDGPPPAREQLPLPRRQRQAHLEPRLRTAGGTGTGTPFAAFTADDSEEGPCPGRGETATARDAAIAVERAAAFQAAAIRARGAARPRLGGSEQAER